MIAVLIDDEQYFHEHQRITKSDEISLPPTMPLHFHLFHRYNFAVFLFVYHLHTRKVRSKFLKILGE